MNGPLISIVIPSFNQGKYIEDSIVSVLSQSYRNFELVIIDGGSTDESKDIIRKYESELAYWVSEKDNGQTHAIVKGLQRCKGELFNWINSDDVLEPDSLLKVANAFIANNKPGLVAGDVRVFGEGVGKRIFKRINHHGITARTLGFGEMCQPGMFYQTSILRDLGLDEGKHYCMDVDLFFKFILLSVNNRVAYVDEPVAGFRLHPDSKTISQQSSGNESAFLKERIEILSGYAKGLKNVTARERMKKCGFLSNTAVAVETDIAHNRLIDSSVSYFLLQRALEEAWTGNKTKALRIWLRISMKDIDSVQRKRLRRAIWKAFTSGLNIM